MATSNQIDIVIPEEVITDVTTKLQEIKTALAPYIFPLTEQQRKTIAKMGDKTLALVEKIVDYSGTNPEFIPSYMDKKGFDDDFNVTTALKPIDGLLQQLQSDVNDTVMLAGHETFVQALTYYNAVAYAAETGQAGAKPIYEDLKARFPGRRTKKSA